MQRAHTHTSTYLFSDPLSKYVFKLKVLYIRENLLIIKRLITLGWHRNLQNQTMPVYET